MARSKKRRIFTEINLIPLIDVALVLVIIFMVITPFLLRSQIEVNIPKSSTAAETPQSPLEVTITKSGHIFIEARSIEWDNLERELGARLRGRPLLIQADKGVDLEFIVKFMDIARRLKVGKLGIAAIQSGT
ncbi:MAG: biopolymer transporter ExbD [Elusimicrobia bacterium]|nr:biopolymer transporter ExbD [Elusimicrobiota bacterium]